MVYLASIGINKAGSITGNAGKSKLIRRSSAKLRKPSVRMKDAGKSKCDKKKMTGKFQFL